MADHDAGAWPQRFTPEHWAGWGQATRGQEAPDSIDAVASLLALRHEHRRRQRTAEAEMVARPLPPPVLLVGLAGAVASGKSTIAAALADRLRAAPHGFETAVVSTDGFLHSNADLDASGLTLRKGFPESYDMSALRALNRTLRQGDVQVSVPVYDHITYDVAAEPVAIDRPEILILEGVNALQGDPAGGDGPGDLADVTIYIDVDEEVVIGWFTRRFLGLAIAARDNPDSFYRIWSDMTEDEVVDAARQTWDAINGVNLRDHIRPSRARADIVVVKDESHAIVELILTAG